MRIFNHPYPPMKEGSARMKGSEPLSFFRHLFVANIVFD